jgi:hypothetical protein
MKKEIKINEHNIHIICGSRFAIVQKKPNKKGIQGITFSEPVPVKVADTLNQSGIVEVISWRADGLLTFRRKSFYETEKFAEIVMDILMKGAKL